MSGRSDFLAPSPVYHISSTESVLGVKIFPEGIFMPYMQIGDPKLKKLSKMLCCE